MLFSPVENIDDSPDVFEIVHDCEHITSKKKLAAQRFMGPKEVVKDDRPILSVQKDE
jgi:hypothetical protein